MADVARDVREEVEGRREVLSQRRPHSQVGLIQSQGYDRYKYFGSPNQIQNQIRLVL